MARLHDLGLDENAEVFIYGDHLSMHADDAVFGSERNLTVFMPLRLQDDKWREVVKNKPYFSYYDFPPSVLEVLRIDYDPPFPFGADFFSDQVGTVPTQQELKFIFELTAGEGAAESARCNKRAGLCTGNDV
jgi:hypothetical protein